MSEETLDRWKLEVIKWRKTLETRKQATKSKIVFKFFPSLKNYQNSRNFALRVDSAELFNENSPDEQKFSELKMKISVKLLDGKHSHMLEIQTEKATRQKCFDKYRV